MMLGTNQNRRIRRKESNGGNAVYTLQEGHFMEGKIDLNEQTMKETTLGVMCYGVSLNARVMKGKKVLPYFSVLNASTLYL